MLTFHDRCNLPSRSRERHVAKGPPIRVHPTPTDPLASGGGCWGESACASGTLTKEIGCWQISSGINSNRSSFSYAVSIFSSSVSLMVVLKFAHIYRWMDFVCSCCCCYVFLVRSKPSIESRFCSGAIGGSRTESFYALLRIGAAKNCPEGKLSARRKT